MENNWFNTGMSEAEVRKAQVFITYDTACELEICYPARIYWEENYNKEKIKVSAYNVKKFREFNVKDWLIGVIRDNIGFILWDINQYFGIWHCWSNKTISIVLKIVLINMINERNKNATRNLSPAKGQDETRRCGSYLYSLWA